MSVRLRPRRSSRPARVAFAAVSTAAALGLAACTGGGAKSASTPAHTPATSTPPGTSSPGPASPATNPLTGIGPVPKTPLIAVKIDDTAPGRPQIGIDQADIVYIEAVEAGYTRLAALYGTNKPTVGYVRSTRPSDPDLLLQYGKITEAYSGGAHVSLDIRKKSGLTGWSNDAGAAGYTRQNRSQSTYINVTLNLGLVAKKVHTPRPTSIGWTFNPSTAGLPTTRSNGVSTTVTGSYNHGTAVQFRYDPKLQKFVRYIDGVAQHAADGKLVTATNVIVQYCRVVSFPADKDVNGYPAQFTYTVGTGQVAVFRQGVRINGTWKRPALNRGTTLTATNGKPLSLDPGNTWVVLVRTGVPVNG